MKSFSQWYVLGVALSVGCTVPTSPSTIRSTTPTVMMTLAQEAAPAPVVPVNPPAPPIAADPPPVPVTPSPGCTPLNPADILWRGPFAVEIPGSCFGDTWRAERVDIASGALNGSGTSPAIPSNGRGTVTLGGSLECGRTYQVDLFRSGSTQMFAAAGVVYSGPVCPPPPPPPPPPPCVITPAGPPGPWQIAPVNTGKPNTCVPILWERFTPMTCGAASTRETEWRGCQS